jgi:catalase
LSLRFWSGDNDADYTDLVAINTQPFMFRTADEFETVTRLVRSNSHKDKVNGLIEFLTATVAGDASLHGLANAVGAAWHGDETLLGRSYWGIHTFFAERTNPSGKAKPVRVPYRYRFDVTEDGRKKSSTGRILAKYRDLVNQVNDGDPVTIGLSFTLPWRWKRLIDWQNVPERVRLDLINPQAVWKRPEKLDMGSIVLDSVVDGKAAWGRKTDPDCDALLFDPTRLTDGLYISEDPMLIALSSIYAESHMRRT